MVNKRIPTFSIEEIFRSGKYVIPIYQRNYAWGSSQIHQLIQDIYDSSIEKTNMNYYIGTLVVYERNQNSEIVYETIDGQQRLTTLNILLSAIHRIFSKQLRYKIDYKLNLEFDVRKKSTDTLAVICSDEDLNYISSKEYNVNIQQGYEDAKIFLMKLLSTEDKINKFYVFLTNYVRIMRVSVPEDTDLNHYFEIMNNRGEQLEKHEIIKARMLNVISNSISMSYTFNLIWEACSDMGRYVQYGFNVRQRNYLFGGELNEMREERFSRMARHINGLRSTEVISSNKMSLEQITSFSGSFDKRNEEDDDESEGVISIIDFSNFLLHVLRIQTKEDISLDDKQLIKIFEEKLNGTDQIEKEKFVKIFGFNLLKCKFLFDKYIIKRKLVKESHQWVLKKMKKYKNSIGYVNTFGDEENEAGRNKPILMLLSMFHVSAPTLVYKHWLNAALFYLFKNPKLSEQEYYKYLKNLAKSFLYDRYLPKVNCEIDYFEIIYKNRGVSQNQNDHGRLDYDKLNQGTAVENFIFNFLDFILWEEDKSGSANFEFSTSRTSVEHYYPQNPMARDLSIKPEIYNLFGNLCLISRGQNSRLSNNMPAAKKDYYFKSNAADSLKQKLMMNRNDWTEIEIKEETKKMKEILIKY